MSLRDFDSHDYYQTPEIPLVYDNVGTATIVPGAGRCGTQALRVVCSPSNAGVVRGVTTVGNVVIAGTAINMAKGSAPGSIFTVYNGSSGLITISPGADGSIIGHLSPGAPFAPDSFVSPGGLLQNAAYHFFAMRLTLDPTNGAVELEIDGQVQYAASGIDTSDRGTLWTGVGRGVAGTSSTVYTFDDWYLMDGDGPAPWNDLLGDVHVEYIEPIAPGAHTGWTVVGSKPTNWQAADDGAHPDYDTSFNSATAAGTKDTYVYSDIGFEANTIIFGLKISALAVKEDPSNRFIAPIIRQGGTDYIGNNLALPAGILGSGIYNYTYVSQIYQTNPATSNQFTPAEVDADEYGMDLSV